MSSGSASFFINFPRPSLALFLLMMVFVLGKSAMAFGEEGSGSVDEAERGGVLVLSLDEALARAGEHSHQVRIGRVELQKAELALGEARGGRLPTISLEGQYTNNIRTPAIVLPEDSPFGGGILRTGTRHNATGSVQASIPVYNAQLNRNIELREVLLGLEEVLKESTVREVEIEVRRAYLNSLMAREMEEILLASYESLERNYEFVRGMYEAGVLPEYDMIRTEVQVRNLEPELSSARSNVQGTLNYLKLLVGIGLNEEIRLQGSLEEIYDDFGPAEELADFRENRDLIQLRGQAGVLEVQQALEEASYLPTVAAFGNFSYQGSGDELRIWDYNWFSTAMVGFSVNIPLFQGGRRQRIDQVRMDRVQLEMQETFLVESLKSQFQTTIERIRTLEETIEAQERNVAQARRGYEIARVSYEEGVHSLIDVNDAESALRDARRNYISTLADYINARLDLEDLLGGGDVVEGQQENGNDEDLREGEGVGDEQ